MIQHMVRRNAGMVGLWVCMLLFTSTSMSAADQELTPEQKLASVRFNKVQSVSIAQLVGEENPAAANAVVLHKGHSAIVLKWISMPESYVFGGTAACFSPGMRITISEETRTVVLDVCLACDKMSVAIDKQPSFMMDFSEIGLALYKSIYFDHVVQAKNKQ